MLWCPFGALSLSTGNASFLPLLASMLTTLICLLAARSVHILIRRARHRRKRPFVYLFEDGPETVVPVIIREITPFADRLHLEFETPSGEHLFFTTTSDTGAPTASRYRELTEGVSGYLSYRSGYAAHFSPVKSRLSSGILLSQSERSMRTDADTFLFHP